MFESFIHTLTGACRVVAGDAVLVCCSGGTDSMVLLELMRRAAPVLNLEIGVIHVDHGLRGSASRAHARFVQDTCQVLGIPFFLYELHMAPDSSNLEEEARTRRYEAVHTCMTEKGYRLAATGHTTDDQAETILYRMIRGSGIRGIAGMDFTSQSGIIRPLLSRTREQIRSFAAENRIVYVHDHTNADTSRPRNLIRHEILPLMEKINPRAAQSLFRLSEIAREESLVMDTQSTSLMKAAAVFDWGIVKAYRGDLFLNAPDAVLRRCIIMIVSSMLDDTRGIDARQVEQICAVVTGACRAHTLKRRLRVFSQNALLVFQETGKEPYYRIPTPVSGTYGIDRIRKAVRIEGIPGAEDSMIMRSALPGDRFRHTRVCELLRKAGVTSPLRPFWPVVLQADRIIAVADITAESPYSVVFSDYE
ncbi:MAG: tRNA lysidine(34) synthetase TilS [Desulfomonilia bacterium]|nr:tRNA lysidine(34) synthetase TilS [Desulfomonilia bacterium]